MELPPPPPPPPPPPTTAVKTQDPEYEPPQSTTIKKQLIPPPLTTTNGVLKRHKPLHHHQPPSPAYKECLKNHAAAMGGHAVDGCGEFMPSPTSSPTYPTSLKCAACGCHRNFHRREPEDSLFPSPTTPIQHVIEYQPHHRHHPPPPSLLPPPTATSPGNSPSPPPISSSYYPSAPHMLLALSSGNISGDHISPIPTTTGNISGSIISGGSNPNNNNKKRFRTKFTQDQKEKMYEIAERVGWKMQKRDEDMIIGFCNQIGVDKNVFKVWMHNNKTTFGNKKDFTDAVNINGNGNSSNNGNNSSGDGGGGGIDFMISRHHHNDVNGNNNNNNNHHQIHHHGDGFNNAGGNVNVVVGTKGSSSSS